MARAEDDLAEVVRGKILAEDARFAFEAYFFVSAALQYGQERAIKQDAEAGLPASKQRHLSGQELCEAVRLFAWKRYGYLAKQVLNNWGIRTTGDIGDIVFNLIKWKQLKKSREDRRADFDDVFDFDQALVEEYRFDLVE